MAEPISIKITNIEQIRAAFKQSPKIMTDELNKAILKALFVVQGETIRNVHPDRGINIITRGLLSATERPPFFSSLKGTYLIDIFYAKFVHDGTRFMKARPFLKRAVDAEDDKTNRFFYEAVDNTLHKIGQMT